MPQMDISIFKQNFDGGSRPNRFVVTGTIGAQGGAVNNILVKAASMPESTLGTIVIPFRGRAVKMPGDRQYGEWTFSILDSFREDLDFRNKFENWNAAFNQHRENIPSAAALNGSGGLDLTNTDLFTTWTVHQLSVDGVVQRSVSLHKCWPTIVAPIDLTYDAGDTLTEYTITLAYDYLEHNADPHASNIK
tara:strand:+ start:301 stop:873 length:573 start_codon:yes stop_codon:yes gene_type:complete